MKKKLILGLVAILLSFSLCACGDGADEKQDIDFKNAISASPSEVYDDVEANQAKAMQNTYKVTGVIDEIKGDYCKIDNLYVYLPTSELASLEVGETIVFFGKITNVEEEGYSMGGGYFTKVCIKFENATLNFDAE